MKCIKCQTTTSNPKFCSRSCSSKYNNILPKRKLTKKCKTCSSYITKGRTYCSTCFYGTPTQNRTEVERVETSDENPSLGANSCSDCGGSISRLASRCLSCASRQIKLNISKAKLQDYLSGEWSGGTNLGLSQIIRNYLLTKNNHSCSKCGFNTNHPLDGKSILEINHINGDGTDHREDNLEVLCPNCHALTDTYRARNYGNGRPVSYLRKQKER